VALADPDIHWRNATSLAQRHRTHFKDVLDRLPTHPSQPDRRPAAASMEAEIVSLQHFVHARVHMHLDQEWRTQRVSSSALVLVVKSKCRQDAALRSVHFPNFP